MTVKELAQLYVENPTGARYEALCEEVFRQEATARGVIWYNALEEINPVFCDEYSCSYCPVGHDVCQRAADGQRDQEQALRKALEDIGFTTDSYYFPSREEVREAIKKRKAERS